MPLPLPCPQNLLRVGSALLDMGNKRHWELIQQTEGGTAQLLQHFEEYARALARNMPQTYLSPFTIVTPNIGQWGCVWPEGCGGGYLPGNIGMLGTCVCLGTHMCPWCGAGHMGMDMPGGCMCWGQWTCVCLGTCVCSGNVCVLGTWMCVWEHKCVYTWSMCAQGHVSWEHACMSDGYLGTCAGDTDICVAGERVLGNMGMPRGMCVSLGTWAVVCVPWGQWVLSIEGTVFCVFQGWWVLGSVGAGVHVSRDMGGLVAASVCGCVDSLLQGRWMPGSVSAGLSGFWSLCATGLVGGGIYGPGVCVPQDPWLWGSWVPGLVSVGVSVPQGQWVLELVCAGRGVPWD